jgi:MerR family transcriptional regulator/heat shock protein HspR
MTKRKSKGAYMISAVAEMYGIHPQTLRLYEREGLLKPSRTEGNTRLYTDEDLQRLEFILSLARDLGVNISGMAIILQMRERMEEMQRQIQEFVQYIQQEVLTRAHAAADPSKGAIVPVRRPIATPTTCPLASTYSPRKNTAASATGCWRRVSPTRPTFWNLNRLAIRTFVWFTHRSMYTS